MKLEEIRTEMQRLQELEAELLTKEREEDLKLCNELCGKHGFTAHDLRKSLRKTAKDELLAQLYAPIAAEQKAKRAAKEAAKEKK